MHTTPARVPSRARSVLAVHALLCFSVSGCGVSLDASCGVPPLPADDDALPPIAKALQFLRRSQLAADQPALFGRDFAGAWRQCFSFGGRAPFWRDVSPFMAAFIRHSLTLITPANRNALGLTDADIDVARDLRNAAVDFIRRFELPADHPAAGTIGFWPRRPAVLPPTDIVIAAVLDQFMPGPNFNGILGPLNLPWYPPHLGIQPDADCTATAYAVFLDDATLDAGRPVSTTFENFFADWRDLGQVPRRANPPWLTSNSGAFLTWLAYAENPANPAPNDIDPVVNANVLITLGRANKLATPGVSDAVAILKAAVAAYLGGEPFDQISLYYPDNGMFQYSIARAIHQGAVPGLDATADALMTNLLNTSQSDSAGRTFWDRGDPALNTALALLALQNTGRSGQAIDSAIDYLIANQSPDGSWPTGLFFLGRLDDGTEVHWQSTSLTTAFALEALCKHRLPD